MARITETELRRKLREARFSGSSSGATATKVGSTWEYSEPVLYLVYATNISNIGTDGTIQNQSDATGFQYEAFTSTGTLLPWRGYLFSKSMYASGDPTDYIWEDITTYSGSVSFVRYYTDSSGLQVNIGNPTNPGSGVTWTSIDPALAIPANAYWVAEQYTFNGVVSDWEVYPVKSKQSGTPLASYTITGRNKPLLSSQQWSDDTLAAMTAHTGESYSSVTEFGYGTAVVIAYDDGKQVGLYREVAGVGTWVAPTDFIDGDLVVDGTINTDKLSANSVTADKIQSNAITSDKIAANAVTASKVSLVPADVGAGATSGSNSLRISSSKIEIYSGGVLRVKLGDLS